MKLFVAVDLLPGALKHQDRLAVRWAGKERRSPVADQHADVALHATGLAALSPVVQSANHSLFVVDVEAVEQ